MNPTKNDLSLEVRTAVTKLLNERLADLIDLGLQTKQAHWNVKGFNFIALHELFDDIYEELEEHTDTTAERLVALGGIAEGTVAAVGQRTKLPTYPLKTTHWRETVDVYTTALAAAAKLVRESIDKANELGDADTADLFTGVSRALDKNLWFVESHLQGDK